MKLISCDNLHFLINLNGHLIKLIVFRYLSNNISEDKIEKLSEFEEIKITFLIV